MRLGNDGYRMWETTVFDSAFEERAADLCKRDFRENVKNGCGLSKETQSIGLVFPEHYEEAVENTPARILIYTASWDGKSLSSVFL